MVKLDGVKLDALLWRSKMHAAHRQYLRSEVRSLRSAV